MKKLIAASILLAFLSTAAFAQLKVGFSLDALTDVVTTQSFVDDYGNYDKKRPSLYKGAGSVDGMTSSYWDDSELRLNLTYTRENISAGLQFSGDTWIARGTELNTKMNHLAGTYDNPKATDPTAYERGERSVLNAFGEIYIREYYVSATAGNFYAYYGNQSKRGKTTNFRFANMNDILRNRNDHFGYMAPGGGSAVGTLYTFSAKDVNNLAKIGNDGDQAPYFNLDYNYNAFTVSLAGGWDKLSIDNTSRGASPYDATNVSMALRVSGDKIADLVTFDALYKIEGGDDTYPGKIEKYDGLKGDVGDAHGKWTNSFGIYAGLTLMDGSLGVSAGYTGSVVAQEAKGEANVTNPFYSGIDLRVQFTGIDKLRITFNNQFSFAAQNGKKPADERVKSIYGGEIGDKVTESWFGMYNALAVRYMVAEKVSANFEVANRAGFASQTFDGDKVIDAVIDHLGLVLYAQYNFSPNIQLEAGLAMEIQHQTFKEADVASSAPSDVKGGVFRFGIPIRFKVQW